MLEIKIGRSSGVGVIKADGSVVDILTDLSIAIAGIHQQLANGDPEAAELFKHGLRVGIAMEEGSPVWGIKAVGFGFMRKNPGGGNDQV